MVLEWVLQTIDPEIWEKEWHETFFGDPRVLEMKRESAKRIKPAVKGEEGHLNITPKEKPKEATDDDLRRMLGGKLAQAGIQGAKGVPPPKPSTPVIGLTSDGELGIDTGE